MVLGTAPDCPVEVVNAGPIVTQVDPLYTFNCEFPLSHHRSPTMALTGAELLLVLELIIFQVAASFFDADALIFNTLLLLSHHNCPGSGAAGAVPLEKFSSK